MWGKLNLPMFLFSVGLLTLMNMDSLIFLAKLQFKYTYNIILQFKNVINYNIIQYNPMFPQVLICPLSFSHLLTGSEHAHRTS